MPEESSPDPRAIAHLARTVTPDRAAQLAAGLEITRRASDALGPLDYGETEPAGRFSSPRRSE